MIGEKHHIETLNLNYRSTPQETGKVLDYLGHGNRVIILAANGTQCQAFSKEIRYGRPSPFIVEVFDRSATDDYIKNYIESVYEAGASELNTIMRTYEASIEQFLDKYANYISPTEEAKIRHEIVEKFKASFRAESKEVLIERLIAHIADLPCHELARVYEEKFAL